MSAVVQTGDLVFRLNGCDGATATKLAYTLCKNGATLTNQCKMLAANTNTIGHRSCVAPVRLPLSRPSPPPPSPAIVPQQNKSIWRVCLSLRLKFAQPRKCSFSCLFGFSIYLARLCLLRTSTNLGPISGSKLKLRPALGLFYWPSAD